MTAQAKILPISAVLISVGIECARPNGRGGILSTTMPPAFLKVVVKRLEQQPGLAGACAGFEDGVWRYNQLAEHLIEWLPEFALNDREYGAVSGSNARRSLRRAAEAIYTSPKYEKRGEVGEILLHAIIRQEFSSEPVISKIYFKDGPNETVKGFDAVHIVESNDGLELWLGEVKLYKAASAAVRDVVEELQAHTKTSYLRSEFAAICKKIDTQHPNRDAILKLLDPNTSIDEVFTRICIPVLLTYDSTTVAAHSRSTTAYNQEIISELEENFRRFSAAKLPSELKIILILIPMNTKSLLLERFDRKLKGLLE